jgi:hypothetical protein
VVFLGDEITEMWARGNAKFFPGKPLLKRGISGKRTLDESIRVLLIDDQAIVGESVRRLLANEPDISFRYCADPDQAI